MSTAAKARTRYANVDLDVYSRTPLDGLVQALGKGALTLYVGGEQRAYEAHVELASGASLSADDAIRGLARLIRRLPPAHRKTWDSARRREFNVGIEAGIEPHAFELRLQPRTLKAVADLRGVLAITVYAPQRRRGTKVAR